MLLLGKQPHLFGPCRSICRRITRDVYSGCAGGAAQTLSNWTWRDFFQIVG